MRDIKRIYEFSNDMATLWAEKIPDWRFGQFMSNFLSWVMSEKNVDIFFPEEDEMMKYMKEFLGEL